MTEVIHAGAGRLTPRRPFALRGLLLWVVGAALLAASAALLWRTFATPPAYRYEPVPAGAAGGMQQVKVIGADDSVLAEADVVPHEQGRVLLGWRAQVDDPLLHLAVPADETKALAPIIARHRQPGMPVMAWWDSSRQLRHWGAGEVLFDRHLAKPLFVPERWRGQREQVARIERAFWGQADAGQLAAFETFTRALASSEGEGVKLLRSLAPGGRAIVVLHLRDLLLLGELYPQLLGVSFQDFADSGDVHRSVRGVHGWLRESTNTAYAVTKLPGNLLRTIALKDRASADSLIARLLPLIGNTQVDVRGLTLVYRFGGYVVFELSAADSP
jgi:hydroxylamine oxidation protein HaoB